MIIDHDAMVRITSIKVWLLLLWIVDIGGSATPQEAGCWAGKTHASYD